MEVGSESRPKSGETLDNEPRPTPRLKRPAKKPSASPNPFESGTESDDTSSVSTLSSDNPFKEDFADMDVQRRSLPSFPSHQLDKFASIETSNRASMLLPARPKRPAPPPPPNKPPKNFGKKRPAPPRPMPMKRQIVASGDILPVAKIQEEFVELDRLQTQLEQRARVVEEQMRLAMAEGSRVALFQTI